MALRLSWLEADRAVLGNIYRYGHSIDYGLHDEWLDCFTDDAVYDLRYPPGQIRGGARGGTQTDVGYLFRGRDQLASFISSHTFAPDRWHKHLLVQPAVTVGADEATC